MLTNRQKKKYFIILVLATILIVAIAGYFSATKKSEPVYLSKIDRIMFDKENQSPKFILTLPDKKPEKKTEQAKKQPEIEKKAEPLVTIDDFVSAVPLVSKLAEIKDQKPLKTIELNADFVEQNDSLKLPKTAENGRKPWIEYGRNVEVAPNFSKVAIILKNIGLDDGVTEAAISAMPSEISLSFSPYTVDAAAKIKKARSQGHETYIDLLLSSKDVLKSDNGPLAMSLTLSPEENMQRLRKVLAVEAPIGGMVINDGVADNDTRDQLAGFLKELKTRGLLMIDTTANMEINHIKEPGLARKRADIVIEDDCLTPEKIAARLEHAEHLARDNGQVTIVALPKPVILTAISEWVKTFSQQMSYEQMKEQHITSFDKPLALVPASNLVVE